MRRSFRILRRTLGILAGGTALVLLGLALPIGWTEMSCRGAPTSQAEPVFITAPGDRRAEARTFLTYPEWHVVYAYEELGQVLAGGDPHDFAYWPAVTGFWSALCAVTKEADSLGEAGLDAKLTIYTVGASFTIEMMAKAAYEETLGRLALMIAGSPEDDGEPSPQDGVEARMAETYGAFLQQTPWYRFDFDGWRETLWDAPLAAPLRGWERRLAVGLEWSAKAAYARLIAGAAGAMGADETEMKVHVTGLGPDQVAALKDGVLSHQPDTDGGTILTVARYRTFTRTAEAIAAAGGTFTEIAGNDDILVTLLSPGRPVLPEGARLLRSLERQGAELKRHLVAVKVSSLTSLIRGLPDFEARLEHVYDY